MLLELFEHQVIKAPILCTVCETGASVTYRELNEKAIDCASLRRMRIGPESVVGLLAYRNVDFLTAVLAVFKAGGAYLAIRSGSVRRVTARYESEQSCSCACD